MVVKGKPSFHPFSAFCLSGLGASELWEGNKEPTSGWAMAREGVSALE